MLLIIITALMEKIYRRKYSNYGFKSECKLWGFSKMRRNFYSTFPSEYLRMSDYLKQQSHWICYLWPRFWSDSMTHMFFMQNAKEQWCISFILLHFIHILHMFLFWSYTTQSLTTSYDKVGVNSHTQALKTVQKLYQSIAHLI